MFGEIVYKMHITLKITLKYSYQENCLQNVYTKQKCIYTEKNTLKHSCKF